MISYITELALLIGYVVIAWWTLIGVGYLIWHSAFREEYECTRYRNEYGPDGLRRRK